MRRAATFVSITILLVLPLANVGPAGGSFPGENGAIAFGRSGALQRQTTTDIAILPPGSDDAVRLTFTPRRNERWPDWNAGGTQLVFSRCARNVDNGCDIWTMEADGSNKTQLTATTDMLEVFPAWSPDGTQIVFGVAQTTAEFSDGDEIWVTDADGTDQVQLTDNEVFDGQPEWSPDGSMIVFSSTRGDTREDIWMMSSDGSNPQQITNGFGSEMEPDWSPDGSRIVFNKNGDIWTMNSDGTDKVAVTSGFRYEFAPAFSPDGLRIAYNSRAKDLRFSIWTIGTDGSHRIRRTFRNDFQPDWQPS